MYGKSSKMLEHEIHLVVHGGLGLCEGCVVLCKGGFALGKGGLGLSQS